MEPLIKAAVEGIRKLGLEASYDWRESSGYGHVIVSGARYDLSRGYRRLRNSLSVDYTYFTKTQSQELALHLLQTLPGKLAALNRTRSIKDMRDSLAVVANTLRKWGMRIGTTDSRVQLEVDFKLDDDGNILNAQLIELIAKHMLSLMQVYDAKLPDCQYALVQSTIGGNSTPIAVYADYLEENGDAESAQKLRDWLQTRQ